MIKRLFLIVSVLTVLFNSVIYTGTIAAQEQTCEELRQELLDAGEDVSDFGCASDIDDEPANDVSSTEILKSFDESIAANESDNFYIKYFYPIHLQHSFADVDDKFTSADTFPNLATFIISLLGSLVGLLTYIVNFLTMLIANLALGDTLSNIFRGIITLFSENVFDFDNPSGTGMVIVMIIALLVIIRNIFAMAKNSSLMDIAKMILVVLILAVAVPLSYTEVRPLLHSVSDDLEQEIYDVVYGEEDMTSEVRIKKDIFKAQRFTAYMIQNFGVGSIEELATERDITEEEAEKIVSGIINGNEEIAKEEYSDNKNKRINTNIFTAFMHLLFNVIMFVHSVLVFIILGVIFAMLILFKIIETIAFGFVWVNVVLMMFNIKENNLSSFLVNRLQFIIVYVIGVTSILLFLQFAIYIIIAFVSVHIMLLLVAEIIMIALMMLVYKNKDVILRYISKLLQISKAIITGDYQINDLVSDVKSAAIGVKTAIINSEKIEKNEDDEDDEEGEKTKNNKEGSSNKDVYDKSLAENNDGEQADHENEDDEEDNDDEEDDGKTNTEDDKKAFPINYWNREVSDSSLSEESEVSDEENA